MALALNVMFLLLAVVVNRCDGNQCRNGAQCVVDATQAIGYRCVCLSGFQGTFCEQQISRSTGAVSRSTGAVSRSVSREHSVNNK